MCISGKWPHHHFQYCAENGLLWPVTDSVFSELPLPCLRELYPYVGELPARELDVVIVRDYEFRTCRFPSDHPVHEWRNGDISVFIDLSQALGRRSYQFRKLGCILPGSNFLKYRADLSVCRILSGTHLLRIQGICNSLDHAIDYTVVPERCRADLAGNAVNGWSCAEHLITAFGSSTTRPQFRKSQQSRSFRQDGADTLAKRLKPGSGLACLLSIS